MNNNIYLNIAFYFLFLLLFLIINTIQYELKNNNLQIFYSQFNPTSSEKDNTSLILAPLKKILKETFSNITNSLIEKKNISEACFNSFNNTFFTSNNSLYLDLFLKLISINSNEVSYYEECINDELELNTSYVIIKYYEKKEENESAKMTYYFPDNRIRGFCMPTGCKENEYTNIIKELIIRREEIMPLSSEFLDYPNKSFIIQKEEFKMGPNNIQLLFNYFLLIFSIIEILLCFFPGIAFYFSYFFLKCLCCCLKYDIKKKALKKKFIGFKKCFSMSNNFNKLNDNNEKEEGLYFVQGIRGLNIFFYTIGMVFIIILHSPSKNYSPQIVKDLFRNPFYCVIFYSIKYAPVFLLACSGTILGYKFLNFLDEKIKQKKFDDRNEEEEERINLNNISLDKLDIIANQNIEINFDYIHKGLLFKFIFYQLDKYFLFILILLFTRYSMYYFTLETKRSPTWEYIRIFLNEKISFIKMIINFFLFPRFNFIHKNNDEYAPIFEIIFDYYWLAFNEIILFIIGIFIIYYCSKKKRQFLYTVYIITGIFILVKFLLYFIQINKLEGNNYAPYILTYSYYGKIIINPLSHLGIYLIGEYFGILLYIYQKEITIKKAELQGKKFLTRISLKLIRILKSTKNNKRFILSIFSLFFIIIFSIGQFFLNSDDIITKIFNFLYIFDNEIIIFFTFDSIFYMVTIMNIQFFSFLKSNFWRMLNKIYFSYIIICIPVILYFVYHSNSKILFNFTNIIFYSSIIIVFTFIIGLSFYMVFEIPLKNIIRTLLKKKEKSNLINKIEDIANIRTVSSFTIDKSKLN